ncbi:MAG: substrate-binding domain-containing protein [Verrucomicrobiaceae bacterium]|nr:substrate-binding domain-containing protein [Verrucomicrobiaceae bacterium]
MRSKLLRILLWLPALLLGACDPGGDAGGDPFAEHELQRQRAAEQSRAMTFRPPPELASTLGIQAEDARQEIVLLQASGAQPYGTFQRQFLATLVAAQRGWKFSTHDAAGSAARQQEQWSAALAQKPAAILLDPVDAAGFAPLMAQAVQSGVVVIGLDPSLQGCTTIVHCPPQAVGATAAALAIDALKRKAADEGLAEPSGRIVQLRTDESSSWSNRVAAGFGDGLRKASSAILVHDAPTDSNADQAVQRLGEAFRIQKQFDIIFCHSDAVAAGAARFADSQGIRENTLIIGVDGIPGRGAGLQLLRDGEIDATIARPPLVDLALRIAVKLRADPGFKPQPAYELAPLAVTPRNHAEVSRRGSYKLPEL